MQYRAAIRWCMAAVTLVVADAVLTAVGLSEGHAEGNPLLAWGIEAHGVWFMFIVKAVGLWLLTSIVFMLRTPKEISLFGYGCMALALIHTVPVLSWSYILVESL